MHLDAFVTLLTLTLSLGPDGAAPRAPGSPAVAVHRASAAASPSPVPKGPAGAPPQPARHARRRLAEAAAPRRAGGARADDLYSLRARRRFAAYLRMRLLEMREAGLERAADAVERRLPADLLLASPAPR